MSDAETAALLRFPCEVPVKVMGRSVPGFDSLVVGIVRRHAPNLPEGAVSMRASRGGTYVAVTVTVPAESREQLDAIYRDLSACPDVLMSL
jgi:putative lipoic acid-binding regulatory protein